MKKGIYEDSIPVLIGDRSVLMKTADQLSMKKESFSEICDINAVV
jgi:hypothetical protein